MKAKFEPRIDLKNRTKLETVIPLKTPFVVFLDPSDACNFKCRFCPTSDRSLMKSVSRPWQQMPFELFKKIIDDMALFPQKIQVLRLYKDGEPLLNKKLADMVKYAKDANVANKIDTTTNASLLTKEKGKALADAGLDQINISIYGVDSERYNSFSGVKIEFEKVLSNVREFYENKKQCEMLVKINGDQLSERERELFLSYFGDYTDKIYIENTMSCWPEFELRGIEVNNQKGIYGQEIIEVDTCPYPFYSFSINSDGVASVCFLDWGRKLIIGDARTESVPDIWDGKLMRAYRKMFLDGKRKAHPVCGGCGQLTHGLPDNLDQHRDLMRKKLDDMAYFSDIPDIINRII